MRKAIIRFITSVHLSVRMKQLGPRGTEFRKREIFTKLYGENPVCLKFGRNNRHSKWRSS